MRALRRPTVVLLALAASAVLLTSCGSSTADGPTAATTGPAAADLPAPTADQMVGRWSVFALTQEPGPSEQEVTFTTAELSTSDGCNTSSGAYTLGADGAFKVGDLVSTRKACATPADTRHIDALKAATKVGLDTRSGFDQLVFTDSGGALVLVLQDAAGG